MRVYNYNIKNLVNPEDFSKPFFFVRNYPFGMLLPYLSHSESDGYRYGYQGSEKDDEIKGNGNSYTTHFRQLDPRVGRWLSIDPKATAWESPYVNMGNNPVLNNDKLGDVFDPASQKTIDNHKTQTKNRITSTQKEIGNLHTKIAERGTKGATNSQSEKLKRLNSDLVEYNDAIKEISDLESSTQLYTVGKLSSNKILIGLTGLTSYDNKTNSVLVEFSNEGTLAHELKHAFQFEKGDLSFDKTTGNAGYLHDANDEVEAYKREGAYDGDDAKRNITVKDVISRNTNYAKLLNGPLNVNSTIEQVFRGRSAQWDSWLNSSLSPAQQQLPYGSSATLFDDIIK